MQSREGACSIAPLRSADNSVARLAGLSNQLAQTYAPLGCEVGEPPVQLRREENGSLLGKLHIHLHIWNILTIPSQSMRCKPGRYLDSRTLSMSAFACLTRSPSS